MIRVIAEVQSGECRKAQLTLLGETERKLRGLNERKDGWAGGWAGIIGNQEQYEQRHRYMDVRGNPKEGQISEVAACGYICAGCFRDSLNPKIGSLVCQAQKSQLLQAMWQPKRQFEHKYLSSPVEGNIVERWAGKGRPRTTIQVRRIRWWLGPKGKRKGKRPTAERDPSEMEHSTALWKQSFWTTVRPVFAENLTQV